MCHQAVGLIQAELERRGIRTASITMLPEVTAAVRPPRALSVPFPLGYPLGKPSDAPVQRRVLRELLRIALSQGAAPIAELPPEAAGSQQAACTPGRPSSSVEGIETGRP
jgi:hypothetical protein